MASEQPLLLGMEIGGSKLQLVAATSPGNILRRQRVSVKPGADAVAIRQDIGNALQLWKGTTWQAVGIGFGGPVDRKAGRVHCSHQVAGWNDMDLCGWLSALLDAPSAIDNDTNVGALAESYYGAGAGHNPVFYTNSGSGVGGGLVVDGRVYHGAPPGEAEFGHLRLAPAGSIVEECCSGWAVDRKVREHCLKEPDGLLAALVAQAPGREARHLKPALQAGDAAARQILCETAATLAFALSHVVHLFHPALVILGGGLSLIGEPWRAAVAEALPPHVMPAFRPGPEVRLAALGEDVVPIGALMLAESRVVSRTEASEVTPVETT